MGKPTSGISAAQVHAILKKYGYEFVPAPADRDLKQIAKAAAKDFRGVKISIAGDSVYFRYAGGDGKRPTDEFFVPAKGMVLENTLKTLEQKTGIKFAEYVNN